MLVLLASALGCSYFYHQVCSSAEMILLFHIVVVVGAAIFSPNLRRLFFVRPKLHRLDVALILLPGLGSLALVAFSRGMNPEHFPSPPSLSWQGILLAVVLVPIAEEGVFRGVLRVAMEAGNHGWRFAYYRSLFFSLVHTNLSWENLIRLNVGIALGPFLLGLIGEYLLAKYRSLWPGIWFHGSANATVYIFGWGDSRWFVWLKLFYI